MTFIYVPENNIIVSVRDFLQYKNRKKKENEFKVFLGLFVFYKCITKRKTPSRIEKKKNNGIHFE